MEPMITPEEAMRLNDLWHTVRPRLERVETPADFLALTPPEPLRIPETVVRPETPPPVVASADGQPRCFQALDAAAGERFAALAQRERGLESRLARMASRAQTRAASRLFSSLRRQQRALAQKLTGAYYLLHGQKLAVPQGVSGDGEADWLVSARTLFHEETRAAHDFHTLAGHSQDACLQTLLTEVGNVKKEMADAIFAMLGEHLI